MTAAQEPARPKPWIGAPVRRIEDPALLMGKGRYVGDIQREGLLHVAFVRSAVASARVVRVDTSPALAGAGVLHVLTANELDLPPLQPELAFPGFVETAIPTLVRDRVGHVGDAVAVVVADSPYRVEDGAESVVVEYDMWPTVSCMGAALAEEAPLVHGQAAGNLLLEACFRDDPDIDEALDSAAVVIDVDFQSARVNAVPLEGRAVLAEWDSRRERLVMHTSTQVPHLVRTIVPDVVGLPEDRLRVVAPDVGGGFGQKCDVTREEALVAATALHLRRPVRWVEDPHGSRRDPRPVPVAALPRTHAGRDHQQPAHGPVPGGVAPSDHPADGATDGQGRPPPRDVTCCHPGTQSHPPWTVPVPGDYRHPLRRGRLPRVAPALCRGTQFRHLGDSPGPGARRGEAGRTGACLLLRADRLRNIVFAARGMAITPGFETAEIRIDPSGGATVLNAVNDAVAHLGLEIDVIPVTPDRVLALLRDAPQKVSS